MVNGYAQTSEKIALSKLLGGRVRAPLRAAPAFSPGDYESDNLLGRLRRGPRSESPKTLASLPPGCLDEPYAATN